MPRRKKEEEALLSAKDRVPRGTANARERTRMRVLSKAFGRLKLTLPWVPPDTKLSKLDTLRLATSYIGHLKRVLQADDQGAESEVDGDNNAQQSQKSREQDHLTMVRSKSPFFFHHLVIHGREIALDERDSLRCSSHKSNLDKPQKHICNLSLTSFIS